MSLIASSMQLMTEMQRLVGDSDLRDASVSSWKSLLPSVLQQLELEATHNKCLHQAIGKNNLTDVQDTGTF